MNFKSNDYKKAKPPPELTAIIIFFPAFYTFDDQITSIHGKPG
jgi:hypothetical protein